MYTTSGRGIRVLSGWVGGRGDVAFELNEIARVREGRRVFHITAHDYGLGRELTCSVCGNSCAHCRAAEAWLNRPAVERLPDDQLSRYFSRLRVINIDELFGHESIERQNLPKEFGGLVVALGRARRALLQAEFGLKITDALEQAIERGIRLPPELFLLACL